MKKLLIIPVLGLLLLAGCAQQGPDPAESTQPSVTEMTPQTEPTDAEPAPTEPPFTAGYTKNSDPANWNVIWEIYEGDTIIEDYVREKSIFFEGSDYFALPGIASFRGGNYRTDASYGTADITEGTITRLWKMSVGYLREPGWGGCCWTGQPLVVQWDDETKAIMNLYEDKKEKEDLVEVIYAKMDGYVHFFDLEDGSYTRDPLYMGAVFKGAGALDPRGYPILYLGSGLMGGGDRQTMYAVSLIDGSILYARDGFEEFTSRQWYAFDGAPLVDAETDTLIWGCESGLLYTIKLNTRYDKAAGTVSMDPDEPVMTLYNDDYTNAGRNSGYESSVTAVENYLYIGNNAGLLQCVDVNTMELVWVQDIVDDINATSVFDWGADGNGYLYVAPSMDYSGRFSNELPLCKIDARTGEILWTHPMQCGTYEGVPGGILASPLLGRAGSNMEDLIVFSVGASPNMRSGQVVALDKESGEVVWQYQTDHYMWSSPVALYTEDGRGYIFQVDSDGVCCLLDGATGQELGRLTLDGTTEASPVAFGNHVVIGTRASIYLLEIS